MKKLTEQSHLNSGESYDQIFRDRAKKGRDEQDMKRWVRLLRHFSSGDLVDLGCLDSAIVDLVLQKENVTYTG
ncbi:MAG: hypothetical protein WAV09_01405, partial [Minisyncoccia bacterium]